MYQHITEQNGKKIIVGSKIRQPKCVPIFNYNCARCYIKLFNTKAFCAVNIALLFKCLE